MSNIFATSTAPASLVRPATDAQLKFVRTLIAERDWNAAAEAQPKHVSRVATVNVVLSFIHGEVGVPQDARLRAALEDDAQDGERLNRTLAVLAETAREGYEGAYKALDTAGASKLIEWLKGQPVKATREGAVAARYADLPDAEQVPAGRYAVDTEDGATNEVAFYKVDRPTEGRWAGRVFVKRLQGGDEVNVWGPAVKTILGKIAADAEAASARYGHEVGRCGICHTRLTNDESRARGIGPKCAAKSGW